MKNHHSNSPHFATVISNQTSKLAGLLIGVSAALLQQSACASQTTPSEMAPLIVSANDLLGRDVRAWRNDGQQVGKISDALFDSASGQLVAWVATAGNSAQCTVIPAKACIPSTEGGQPMMLVLCSAEGFNASPRVAKETAGGKLSSATKMLGQQVIGSNGKSLGQVQDITFDTVLGKAVYIVIRPSVGANRNADYYAVPSSALQANFEGNQLVLSANQATFLAGPHFPKMYSAELAQPRFAAAVYAQYGTQNSPWAFLSQTTPATLASTGTAIPSTATGRSDAEISSAFLIQFSHAMPAPNSPNHDAAVREGSIAVRKVNGVGTVELSNSNIAANPRGGRLILTGDAVNENQRQQMVAAASRVVGSDNVDDQMTVR